MTVEKMRELPKGGRLALDIETISPNLSYDDYPDFDDPNDFEFLATAMCYEPPEQEEVVDTILWRSGLDTRSELDHARDVAEITAAVEPNDLITYNGDRFDLWLLLKRAEQGGEEVGDITVFKQLQHSFGQPTLIDLKHSAWEAYGDYTSLEELVGKQDSLSVRKTLLSDYNHGHSLSYRPRTEPPHLKSTDVPMFGEAMLRTAAGEEDSVNVDETRAMLNDYALGDIEHLLELANRHPF